MQDLAMACAFIINLINDHMSNLIVGRWFMIYLLGASNLWIQFALSLIMRISCRVLKHILRSGYWLLLEMENQMNRDSDAERYHLMEYLRIYHLSKWNPQN